MRFFVHTLDNYQHYRALSDPRLIVLSSLLFLLLIFHDHIYQLLVHPQCQLQLDSGLYLMFLPLYLRLVLLLPFFVLLRAFFVLLLLPFFVLLRPFFVLLLFLLFLFVFSRFQSVTRILLDYLDYMLAQNQYIHYNVDN